VLKCLRILLFSLLLLLCCSFEKKTEPDFYLGGVEINEPDKTHWLKTIKEAGMNTVPLTVYSRQAGWNSEYLWFDRHDTTLVGEIRQINSQGLNVILVLRTLLDRRFSENDGLWHGMIMPKSEDDLKNWFKNYGAFVLKWAKIAEEQTISALFIGSELRTLSGTAQVDTIPKLLEYYTNLEKLKKQKARLMKFADQIDQRHLWVPSKGNHGSLSEYIDDLNDANIKWAAQVSHLGENDSLRLVKINTRRQLIENHWIELIRKVREVYLGKIGYAANFDNYQQVRFWPHLDFIGINAYFKLRKELAQQTPKDSLLAQMQTSWTQIFAEVDSFRNQLEIPGKPVIFTELGYTYRKNSTIYPWTGADFAIIDDGGKEQLVILQEQPFDFTERGIAARALYQTNRNYFQKQPQTPLLKGILYWKFSTRDYHLPYEPFMALVDSIGQDPIVQELQRFTSADTVFAKSKVDLMARRAALFPALGFRNWEKTSALTWKTDAGFSYLLDLKRQFVRIKWGKFKALLDLNLGKGLVYKNQKLLEKTAADSIIEEAKNFFERDFFGLSPKNKIFAFDNRKMIQLENNETALEVAVNRPANSTNGKHTVKTKLQIFVDQNGKPYRWAELTTDNQTTGSGFWRKWVELSTGIKIARHYSFGGEKFEIVEAKAAGNLAELGEEEIFAELLNAN